MIGRYQLTLDAAIGGVACAGDRQAHAALRAFATWRYRPALLHGVAVRQLTSEKFSVASVIVAVPAGSTSRAPDGGPKR